MPRQISTFAPWLRLSNAILFSFGLILILILGLNPGLVQAESSSSDRSVTGSPPARPHQVPGTPALTMTVEATSTTVVPGQTVTYSIEFHHIGGTTPLQARLINRFQSVTLPHHDGLRLNITGAVTPTLVQFSYGVSEDDIPQLRWQGSIAPDSKLQIRYTAQVEPCRDPNPLTVQNQVGVQIRNVGVFTDPAILTVDCLPAVDPAKVNVSSFWGSETVNELIPGKTGYTRLELSNSDSNPTVLGLFGVFPGRNFNIGMPPTLQRVSDLGWAVERPGLNRTQVATDTRQVYFLVPLAAGETRVISLPIRLARAVSPESEFEIQWRYCITYDDLTCPEADPQSTTPPPSLKIVPALTFTVRYRDLGDAPDSTNHFSGTVMSAYTTIPVIQAEFPTVFDPKTGPVQGPVHLNPFPFHLGRRVSPEAEADIGPDLDPSNNIIPPANVADLDRGDDGIAVNLLNLTQCQTGVVPVRILIQPVAVAYFQANNGKGYLNLWLDSNQDGDWADDLQCPQNQTAVEHIVVDHEIDVVSLGAGLHTLAVPTDLIPWPGNQTAWLRATLSERPSNKPLTSVGITYGDGRGDNTPFQLGETEDYLLQPDGVEGAGPDMAVDVDAGWRINPDDSNTRVQLERVRAYFRINYRNEGSETAQTVTLTHYIPPALRDFTPNITALPELDANNISLKPGQIDISLGDIDSRLGGGIILSWRGCLTCIRRSVDALAGSNYTGTTIIQSSNDTNPDNNQAESRVDIPTVIEAGFASPEGPYKQRYGTTCQNTLDIRGRTDPNTTLNIFADGFESGNIIAEVTSDANGLFETMVTLPNGFHRLRLAAKGIETNTKIIDQSSPLLLVNVNSHLLWDPSSIAFIDSQGRVIRPPNSAGFLGRWRELTSLAAGEPYQLSLAYCGDDPNPTIEAIFFGQTITLSDDDNDGVYQGNLGTPSRSALQRAQATIQARSPLTVSITSNNVETIFGGPVETTQEGVVYDSNPINY